MPRLSQVYGIVISMYYRDHNPPHFHATYGGHNASFGIDPIQIIEGSLPDRVRVLVEEWAGQHQAELAESWQRARRREPPGRIPPLP